jgi:DNA-binding NarL/FixJ family response regulator
MVLGPAELHRPNRRRKQRNSPNLGHWRWTVPIQILIADDHGVVRKGLRILLESNRNWRICAEATNGRKAVEEAAKHQPDIAILDISMPELNGVEATRQIRQSCPHTEVIILTMHESDVLLQESLNAGAKGYLLKEDADDYLASAVEALRQHRTYFSPKITKALSGDGSPLTLDEADRDVPLNRLTSREKEVTQLLTEGKRNKEVAGVLGISVKTVEAHRTRIMLKLGIHSITGLVRYAIRNKIIAE